MRGKIAWTLIFVIAAFSNAFAKSPSLALSKHVITPPPPPLFLPRDINAGNLRYVHSLRRVEIKRIQKILHQLRDCPPASP